MPRKSHEMTEAKPFLSREVQREFKEDDFDFENLALEGGGSSAMAYVGAIRVLEELGWLRNIKRFAGSSAGSIVATFLAIGYNSQEIQKLFQRDFTPIMYDGSCMRCGQVVNLFRRLGAHPGKKLENWIANNIKDKTGDKNYTFRQLYEKDHVELCILATDLSKMDTVYFHFKTTPDMPIYLAARASSSVPGLLKPVKWNKGVFVDGGVLCNYPLHVFDGWYLSMEEGDQFLKRFSDLAKVSEKWTTAERFGEPVNQKTLGVMTYSASDPVLMKDYMEKRTSQHKKVEIKAPKTKLHRKRDKQDKVNTKEVKEMAAALDRLISALNNADTNRDGKVTRQEFMTFYKKKGSILTKEDTKLLFGVVTSKNIADAIFDRIDTDKSGEIEYKNIERLAEQRGVSLAQTVRGYEDRNISDIKEFVSALFETMMTHAQRVTEKSSDCSRTIGINTGYLGAFDWSMEKGDKDFLMECGKQAAVTFLRELKQAPGIYPSVA
ncbi:uncharacterized protein [Asterias amurensis]|uniref:uncharacterized protein isoform X1 n=1 Tax=Asterias amurensis TaxID=7602 RepID=UPI003AB704E5